MSITYECEEYKRNRPIWDKCADCYEGQEAVMRGGERYLPRLSGQMTSKHTNFSLLEDANVSETRTVDMQEGSEYLAYQQRAVYTNYIKKVTDGLVEQLFRKDVKLQVPKGMEEIVNNFTDDGKSFVTAVKESDKDILLNYRSVLVLDTAETGLEDGQTISIKQSEKLNVRPYAVYYKARDVINWKYDYVNNKPMLTLVVIKEVVEDYTGDEFEPTLINQIRVLSLDEDGYYRLRLYKGTNYKLIEDRQPILFGNKLDFIPCYFITAKGLSYTLDMPLLNDACNINLAHYRNSADYENALSITGSPTPVIKGIQTEPDEELQISLGSSKALLLDASGDAYYMEYKGLGPTCIKDAMNTKVDALSVIAGRMLQNDPAGVESAETANIHRQTEYGQLASMARSLSETYTKILEQIAEWMGVNGKIEVRFNTDYVDSNMEPQLLTSLTNALISGSISREVYFNMIEKGEMLPPKWDFMQEQNSINTAKEESKELNVGYVEDKTQDEEQDKDNVDDKAQDKKEVK